MPLCMNVTVILPTYNERENIVVLLDGLRKAVTEISGHVISFLVVDDTSGDGTQEAVRIYAKKHPRIFLLSGKKEGLGRALLRGMQYARDSLCAQVIVQMDADLSHNPMSLPLFLKEVDKGADFVVGSRYIKGGSIPSNWGLHRKIFSVVGNAIVRFGLGFPRVHDWTGGYRAYMSKYYDRFHGEMKKFSGYVFQIAFLHKAIGSGARAVEVPIQFTDRRYGRSKIAPSQYIRDILRYVISQRIKATMQGSFGKFCIVGSVGFLINTVVLELGVRLGFHPVLASITGAECAIVSNFMFNNAWTFRDRKIHGKRRIIKFMQFNATSAGAIVIQAGTIWVGTAFYGISAYRIFYILGVGIGLVWNYIMYSTIIWKRQGQ